AVEARVGAIDTAPQVRDLEVRRMEKEAKRRAEAITEAMGRNPEEARKALEALLGGPLRFTPVREPAGKRFRIEGDIALEAMLLTGTGGPARAETARVPFHERPQRDSNPRNSLERAGSWAGLDDGD